MGSLKFSFLRGKKENSKRAVRKIIEFIGFKGYYRYAGLTQGIYSVVDSPTDEQNNRLFFNCIPRKNFLKGFGLGIHSV